MKKHFICDTHADTLMRMIDLGYGLDDERLQVSVPKMKRGHDLQVFACFIDPAVGKERYVIRTLQMIDLLSREVHKYRKEIALCDSTSGIKRARAAKRKIALLGLEGGHAIANDLSVLRSYRSLGITYMTLTWSNTNDWADSSTDEERWGGITNFGQEVVHEMNQIGMMVDISHVSDKTFWHVLRISRKPPIASHSSVRSLCKHPRNMSDEMIKALADKGGVVFINFYPVFIKQGFLEADQKLRKRLQRRLQTATDRWRYKAEMYTYEEEKILQELGPNSLPEVTLQDIVRHVEHVVKIAGVEAVGFGSDFDGIPFAPKDLADCTSLPRLCEALQKRRFKPAEIDKIAGGNFLRVFAEVVG
ncbi:MAG TPA: dipeptidase [Acidobacteriota bacterium]|nr:dipeptidase [Acidobacteriota bacterium]